MGSTGLEIFGQFVIDVGQGVLLFFEFENFPVSLLHMSSPDLVGVFCIFEAFGKVVVLHHFRLDTLLGVQTLSFEFLIQQIDLGH